MMNESEFAQNTINAISSPVGVYVLETLTSGMYTDARDAIREYIQNSMDSLNLAEKSGLIENSEKIVEILTSESNNSLTILDRGLGISPQEAPNLLLAIGKSNKIPGQTAGFRGIGRLAGIAYCEKLIFKTTASNSGQYVQVTYDCEKIRDNFTKIQDSEQKLIEDALKEACKTEIGSIDSSEHFFEVTLENLKGEGQKFTDIKFLEPYLSYTAPIDFDLQKFVYASKIRKKISESPYAIPTIKITVKNERGQITPILKPYQSTYSSARAKESTRIVIDDVSFFAGPKDMYWGWYGISNLIGTIDDNNCAGLRFRIENILVGGSLIAEELFSEISPSNSRFNRYYIGEIHVNPKNVIPNGRRDGFEYAKDWKIIKDDITESVISQLSKEVRVQSTNRNSDTNKVIAKSEKLIEKVENKIENGIPSKETKENLGKDIETQIEILKGVENKISTNDDDDEDKNKITNLQNRLKEKHQEVVSTKVNAIPKSKATLDRKQKQLLRLIFEILEHELDENTYERVKNEIVREINSPKEGKKYGK